MWIRVKGSYYRKRLAGNKWQLDYVRHRAILLDTSLNHDYNNKCSCADTFTLHDVSMLLMALEIAQKYNSWNKTDEIKE